MFKFRGKIGLCRQNSISPHLKFMLQFPEMQGYMEKYHFQQKADFSEKTEFLKEDGIFAKKNHFFLFFLAFSDIEP